jgi:hypothetical protein
MKSNGVTYIPAKCSKCCRRLAWIAVEPHYEGSILILDNAHNCEEAKNGNKTADHKLRRDFAN